jgi:hypothetical protein
MTRNQLITEIMRQVREVTSDERICTDVLFRLRMSASPVLRDLYSRNAAREAVCRAYAISPSASRLDAPRRSSYPAVTQA